MGLITPKQAVALVAARETLREIQREALQWDRLRELRDEGNPNNLVDIGRVVEAASAADDAVFNVLNTASSYLGDEVAKQVVHSRTAEEADEALTGFTAK